MKEYQVQLERYFFTAMHFNANPEFVEHRGFLDLQTTIEAVKISNDPVRYGINIKVLYTSDGPQESPYDFGITVFGTVIMQEGLKTKKCEDLIHDKVLPILLSAITEKLADMTARGPWGPLYITHDDKVNVKYIYSEPTT